MARWVESAAMANQDDFVKTALRLPRDLHAEIQAAAISTGRSMNAEIIGRLQSNNATADLIRRLEGSEGALLESLKKQIEVLWNVLDRTNVVLDQAGEITARAGGDPIAATLQQNLQFLRELIDTIRAHR